MVRNPRPVQRCQVDLTFYPTDIQTYPGTLTVTTNASDSPHILALTGEGIANQGLRGPVGGPLTLSGNSPIRSRTIAYAYDGLQRLIGATESGFSANVYAYDYDNAGNRTSATVNNVTTSTSYNAANQVSGWTYDNVGNLTNDGTTTSTYDALNRLTVQGTTTNAYNGDDTLVSQTVGGTTTRYTQDLASPLSQILSDGTTTSVYGMERLYGVAGSTRTWYGSDALGSVRQTLNDSGSVLGAQHFDPWGQPQRATIAPFGFTGELQQGASVYLRARWYNAGSGAFGSRDSFAGFPEQPYSLHQYQYSYANPVSNTDPSGMCSRAGDDYCFDPNTNQHPPIQPECALADMGGSAPVYCYTLGTTGGRSGAGIRSHDTVGADTYQHECIGNPTAIESYITLADGTRQAVCLDASNRQLNAAYFLRGRTQNQTCPVIIPGLNGVLMANSGKDEEQSAQLGQSSFLPDLGIPAPPNWLKKLRRGLDGFLRPSTLRNPQTWQEAENMISDFVGVPPNRKPLVKIPVNTRRNTAPDFIGADFLGESKFLDGTGKLQLKQQQRDVAEIAKQRGIPYYVFVTEGKPIDPKLVQLLRDTGGDVIVFFRQP